ncbi:cytochrome P450 [Kitasatospora sp. NPDC059327]|uniref:cytochrome P450 n=1 Tax=Kitasatospora sp. NPDC059327 TaxID=3346803 RepID=UPI0036AA4225
MTKTPTPRPQPASAATCPRRAHAGLPAGPHLTPAELHTMENDRLLSTWEDYARAYGPLFTLHTDGAAPRVYVSDPQAIRRLFIANRTTWGARGTLYFRRVIGAQALPYLTGDAHREVRRLLAPPLHSKPVRALGPHIDDIITTVLDTLRHGPRPLIKVAHDITLRLIVRAAFGPLPEERRELCVRLLTEIMDLMYEPAAAPDTDPAPLIQRIDAHVNRLQLFVREESALLRADPAQQRDDLLFHLATSEPAQNDEQIRGHIMTLLIAGHDTTASALAWGMRLLELHPDVRRLLHAELDSLSTAPPNDPAAVAQLPYLGAICAEILRHGSVVPAGLARIVPEDLDWDGHRFPAGTELVPAIHLVHRRGDLYPDPERFDPQRFLGHRPPAAGYLPFGTGTRRCPGAELAEFELATALARLSRTPGLRLIGAEPGLRTLKNGPTMTTPTSLLVALDAPSSARTQRGDDRA